MRKAALAVAVMFVATLASAQMKKAPQPQPQTGTLRAPGLQQSKVTAFPRISQEDAFKLYREGKATFIDVRSNEQFSRGHIQGAMSIPRSQILRRFAEVMPGKTVITYCACGAEESSGNAAATLIQHGVKNVFALKGGWDHWKDAKRPIATGPK